VHLADGTNVFGRRIDSEYESEDNREDDSGVSTVVGR